MTATITTSTRFDSISFSMNSLPLSEASVTLVTATDVIKKWNYLEGEPAAGTEEGDNLAVMQEIFASTNGFQDEDGNALDVYLSDTFPHGVDLADFEEHGLFNPFVEGSYDRLINRMKVEGAFQLHATVETEADTGRRDIKLGGGLVPEKRTSDSGESQQSLEDWTASNVVGKLRVQIYAPPGEHFDGTDLVADDPRIEAMLRFLDDNRTSGNAINFSGLTLSGLHAALVVRTYTIDQDISATENSLVLNISSTGRNLTSLNLTFNITSGTLHVSLMNIMLNQTSAGIETEAAIEEPPFGSTDVRIRAERIQMGDGQLLSERGVPTWRLEGRSHPMGGSYGKTIRLHDLELHDDGYYFFPWADREAVYDLRAVHIEDSFDVTVRLGAYDEMALIAGSQFSFDIHNANDHGGATVTVEDANDNDLITLLPRETFPVVTEWFTNGNGEIRSARRISRPLEVSAEDKYATMNDVGYWEDSSSHWARPIPFPASDERSSELFYAADVFEIGTATISNGTAKTADTFDLHVKESFKLLKADGRFRYRMLATARAKPNTSGSVFPNIRLWRQRGGVGNTPEAILAIPLDILEADDGQAWELIFEDEGEHVEANDVFCPVNVYNKSASRSPGNVELTSFRLEVYLDEEIVLEYSA